MLSSIKKVYVGFRTFLFKGGKVLDDLMLIAGVGFGIILFMLVLSIAVYFVCAFATYRALKLLGYDKAWLGFIPCANMYALADVTGYDEVDLGFNIKVPMTLFKFWWAIAYLIIMIPVVGGILSFALQILCLGWNYMVVYAMLDGTSLKEQKVIGYISALIGIVPVVKFYTAKKDRIQVSTGRTQAEDVQDDNDMWI